MTVRRDLVQQSDRHATKEIFDVKSLCNLRCGAGAFVALAFALSLSLAPQVAEAAPAPAPAWKILAATGPTNLPPTSSEIEQVDVDAEAGTFALEFGGEATAPIALDAAASELAAALDAVPALSAGGGVVEVSGGPGTAGGGNSYFVRFAGSLAGTNVPQLTADVGGLSGSGEAVNITTNTEGGTVGTGTIVIYATNVGGAVTTGTIDTTVTLPTGITTSTTPASGEGWSCLPAGPGHSTLTCESVTVVGPAHTARPLLVPVEVESSVLPFSSAELTVSGGGAAVGNSYRAPIAVSPRPAPAGIQAFWAGTFETDGTPSTVAGAHPNIAATGFLLNTIVAPSGAVVPAGDARDIKVELPPGFIGDPAATSRCPQSILAPYLCPEMAGTAIGGGQVLIAAFGNLLQEPVNNIVASYGFPAEFGLRAGTPWIPIVGELRGDTDNGINATAVSVPQTLRAYGSFVALYGEPPESGGKAFLTNPSDCAEQARSAPVTTINIDFWQDPGVYDSRSVTTPPVKGCADLASHFNPSFSFQPESHTAASPSPFTANLEIPQEGLTDPNGLVAPELKKAVVTLSKGVNVNPSSANGLEACSEAQMGLITTSGELPNPIRFDKSEPSCPDASKLGTVEAKSPLLEETLEGTIYLAAQDENPFHSLLALYLVIDSPRNGVLVKLPGEVTPDPTTGQLTATFDNNPQLPVEDLKLNVRGGGPRSPLATPAVCGTYTTHGELTPWSAPESGPPAQTEDSFQVTSGPGGGGCTTSEGALPFAPSFQAGTTSTQAGAYAPLVVKVARKDGEQELTRLEFTLPPGLTGKLAGIPYCPDAAIAAAAGKSGRAEQASPSCPSASELGTVDTSAGVGSEPIHVGGHVYLAGPYEGAPLSSVIITPAVAGPFDLGTVVVRAPLFVNPETAQITARSDEIPHILKGIPLQLRSVEVKVTRDGFSLNPTSCNPMTVSAGMSGLNGGGAKPSSRFQVGNCGALAFKPKLKIQLKGATGRIGHPGLKAVLTYPPGAGYANVARAQVNLPQAEFIDQGNLNKTCTKPVLLAGNCPASTIYGRAKAWTPLLEKPLEGYVYLVGGYGYKLPALVADLNGQIRVTLVGKVDSGPNKGIRNTFELVPDAPVSRFVLEMKGGKKYGLFENSENLCKVKKAKRRAIVRFTGQNGKVRASKPVVANQCKKHRRHKSSKKHRHA